MNSRLLYWSITCALAGFIFGFDIVVASGAEQQIEKMWELTPAEHGWAMSSAIWGALLGSLIGGFPTNSLGRKKTLAFIGVLYFISFIGCAFANGLTSFALFRIIGGIGIGISTVAAPIFISEISPAARRGQLTGMFQFNIVFGLLAATLSNALIAYLMKGNEDAWRWMLGVAAIPSLIYFVMCFSLPESPRWLIGKGRREEGKSILGSINPEWSASELERKIVEIETSNKKSEAKGGGIDWKAIRIPIMLAFLVAFFNQLSGINAILGFAPRIFGMTGIDTSASLLNASLITLVNLVFTLVGLRLIDKLGRRTLLYLGSFGYIASLGICAWAFYNFKAPFQVATHAIELQKASALVTKTDVTEMRKKQAAEDFSKASAELVKATNDSAYKGSPVTLVENATPQQAGEVAKSALADAAKQAGSGSTIVLICILGFIAAHAIGQGTVIWVLISEIFPARARAFGQSLGSATHWVFAALLTMFFPIAVGAFSPTVLFAFFCFMMVLHLLWVHFMVPETKGIALEDMEDTIARH